MDTFDTFCATLPNGLPRTEISTKYKKQKDVGEVLLKLFLTNNLLNKYSCPCNHLIQLMILLK